MKKLLIIFALTAFTVSVNMQAQPEGKRGNSQKWEEFKARRTAFLTTEVGITPSEAAQLFPLYDEMVQRKMQVFSTFRRNHRELLNQTNARPEQYTAALNEMLNAPIQEAAIEKEYYDKFKEILSPEKLLRLKMAEGRFARSLAVPKHTEKKP